jgi:hypothetical protein
MIDLNGPVLGTFGIGKFDPGLSEEGCRDTSLLNVAGYIPLIGLITGIYRAIIGVAALNQEDPDTRACGIVFVVRALVECLGLGIIFCAPVDIGCSLARLVREHLDKDDSADVALTPT